VRGLQAAHDEGSFTRLEAGQPDDRGPGHAPERIKVMDFGLAKLIEADHARK